MAKRLLSGVLSVCLCIGVLGTYSHAQDNESTSYNDTVSVQAQNKDSAASWKLTGINFDKNSPQEVSASIKITANIENESNGMLYKYVWMRDNWKEWGVIQDFSENKTVEWTPSKSGNYYIYANVRGGSQAEETLRQPYTIVKSQWTFKGISPADSTQKLGQPIVLSPDISGNANGLKYKYVWMKNNWSEWGLIRDFSVEKEAEFTPKSTGEYTVYLDIEDQDGDVVTKNKTYKIKTDVWQYTGVKTDLPSPQQKYTVPITVSAETAGENSRLSYKYVWMKNNWKEWGVISDFSEKSSALWYPADTGNYTICVDVKDTDGEIITKTIPYEITKLQWKLEAVKINPEEVQRKGEDVEIEAVTSGNTEKLQYKFVWMKDNWSKWGVIQDYSEKSKITWKAPNTAGAYKIYVDVADRDNDIKTLTLDYFIATQIWQAGEININNGVSEQVYTHIPISASAEGETQNLQYKFVWKKGTANDSWGNGWGVISGFSKIKSTNAWYPKEAGTYTIYVDIKDSDGRLKTITKEYQVSEAPWKLDEIKLDGSPDRFLGETVTLTAKTSGVTKGLQYKFVCRRGDGWSDWEVLQDFGENNTVTIRLDKDKAYHIYVDIKDQRGVVFDAQTVTVRPHNYISAAATSTTVAKGKSVTIYPNVTGGTSNLEFKYVWMKDNWKKWGVIKESTSSSSVLWTPTESGTYYIYIDVKINGVVKTKSLWITVKDVKNGWYYENGYKFYYKDDVKQLDLDGILPRQSSYYVKINRRACTVTVYAKDGNNGYIIPVKRFACSVGLPSTPTPTGTYYTLQKYRWHVLMGPSYGQYCTQIVGGIFFHSVAGRNMTSYNLKASDYNKLGQPASHGCVRLCVRDAKWIYDNCSLGTKVTIYDSSDPGPLGKPATIKIPANQTWDPTDPNI